jgi:two-component system phosphate regulon sensor histidine kinase PhoR
MSRAATGDPLWRAVFLRALPAVAAVVLASLVGPLVGVAVALVASAVLATVVARRADPLRRRVLALAEEASGTAAQGAGSVPTLARLALLVDETRDRLADARRKVELERDDVLALLEATSEGILVIGQHNRIEMLNDAARRLLEPPVDPLGRSLFELARQPELLEFAEALRQGKTPEPRTIQIAAQPASGANPRWLSLSGAVVSGERMRSRAVLVLHDLTGLRHLESVRTDFVANATHEMRSPLTSILGFAETLADDPALQSGEARDHLERIVRNARRLDDIVRDLIELSRLEHGAGPRVQPTEVARLIRDAVEDFQDAARAKGVRLAVETGALPPSVEVDPELVRQALANLIDNAVKYTPAGGEVVVRASVEAEERGERLEVHVADTGPGIPAEHQGRIFERFYRVDTARSRALGGTGLGLSIVKHAAALSGGRVTLESVPGRGSTFGLVLPLPRRSRA